MIVDAVYTSENLPDRFLGNPLIEALPEIIEPIALLKMMALRPKHNLAASKRKPAFVRLYDVPCIKELYVPPPFAMEFCIAVDLVLRNSYSGRNPFLRDTQEWLHSPETLMRLQGAFNDTLEGMIFVIGGSGQGKTRLICVCLSRYPQCIRHRFYGGREFYQMQVVWIRAEVPSTGSLRTLMYSLFSSLDEALGQPGTPESYITEHEESSVDTMILNFAKAAKNHFLGIIHIDDVQRSLEVHSGKAMVKFIIQLAAALKCPVIFSATEDVMAMFEEMKKFESARRAIKEGAYYMHRALSADDPFFTLLFGEAMKWQWTDEPIAPSDSLKKLLFNLSVGITAIFVFLHMQAQIRALMVGATRLDVAHYFHVYKHRLRPLRRLLQSIRASQPYDPKVLEEFLRTEMGTQPGN
jgi:hypothetical protein